MSFDMEAARKLAEVPYGVGDATNHVDSLRATLLQALDYITALEGNQLFPGTVAMCPLCKAERYSDSDPTQCTWSDACDFVKDCPIKAVSHQRCER